VKTASVAAALFCGGLCAIAAQNGPAVQIRQTIALPGVEGRIDHFSYDPAGERLFVCALGSNSVEVVDLRKGERIHTLGGFGSPQGILYVHDPDRLFVANDKGGILKIFDGKLFEPLGEVNLKDDADNVRYDEATKKVYVGFGSGGIGVVSAPDGKQIGSIKLSTHPEAFELEKNGKRIFVNVPNSRHVAVIDRDKNEVIAQWQTDMAFGNFPMALDEANHRLFIGCRFPPRLVVLNTNSGDVVSKTDISGDCDELFYDSNHRRIYAICGAGEIDVIQQTDPNTYKTLAKVDTAKGARTGLFVSEQARLFVAVPHRASQRAEIRVYDTE
jgi:DNA-binding beta-propeller fold protein YncE